MKGWHKHGVARRRRGNGDETRQKSEAIRGPLDRRRAAAAGGLLSRQPYRDLVAMHSAIAEASVSVRDVGRPYRLGRGRA